MNQVPIIQPGEKAKNFSLKDHEDRTFGLYEHMGRRVLLSFHPLAWTPVCAAQMKSLEENRERFDRLNTVAVGLSVDSVPCKKAWAGTLGITHTPLLCDFWPHGNVAAQYRTFPGCQRLFRAGKCHSRRTPECRVRQGIPPPHGPRYHRSHRVHRRAGKKIML